MNVPSSHPTPPHDTPDGIADGIDLKSVRQPAADINSETDSHKSEEEPLDTSVSSTPPESSPAMCDSDNAEAAIGEPHCDYDLLVAKIYHGMGALERALLVFKARKAYEKTEMPIGRGKHNTFYTKTEMLTKLTKRTLQSDIKLIEDLSEPLAETILAKREIHMDRQLLLLVAASPSKEDKHRLAELPFTQLKVALRAGAASKKSPKKAENSVAAVKQSMEKVEDSVDGDPDFPHPDNPAICIDIDTPLSDPVWAKDVFVRVTGDQHGIRVRAPSQAIESTRTVDAERVEVIFRRMEPPLEETEPTGATTEADPLEWGPLTPRTKRMHTGPPECDSVSHLKSGGK
jgi:hypothetical protein